MRVLAKRGDSDYLVLVKDDEQRPLGVVVNVEDEAVFNLWNVHSILARGYWDEIVNGDPGASSALKLAEKADKEGKLTEPDLGLGIRDGA